MAKLMKNKLKVWLCLLLIKSVTFFVTDRELEEEFEEEFENDKDDSSNSSKQSLPQLFTEVENYPSSVTSKILTHFEKTASGATVDILSVDKSIAWKVSVFNAILEFDWIHGSRQFYRKIIIEINPLGAELTELPYGCKRIVIRMLPILINQADYNRNGRIKMTAEGIRSTVLPRISPFIKYLQNEKFVCTPCANFNKTFKFSAIEAKFKCNDKLKHPLIIDRLQVYILFSGANKTVEPLEKVSKITLKLINPFNKILKKVVIDYSPINPRYTEFSVDQVKSLLCPLQADFFVETQNLGTFMPVYSVTDISNLTQANKSVHGYTFLADARNVSPELRFDELFDEPTTTKHEKSLLTTEDKANSQRISELQTNWVRTKIKSKIVIPDKENKK